MEAAGAGMGAGDAGLEKDKAWMKKVLAGWDGFAFYPLTDDAATHADLHFLSEAPPPLCLGIVGLGTRGLGIRMLRRGHF